MSWPALTSSNDAQREQAGAGLDCLTPGEMVAFTQLNDDYKAKFAFPFILAVKGTCHSFFLRFECCHAVLAFAGAFLTPLLACATKADILDAYAKRCHSPAPAPALRRAHARHSVTCTREEEFLTAVTQVLRIVRFR
jgi:hypothetical protein